MKLEILLYAKNEFMNSNMNKTLCAKLQFEIEAQGLVTTQKCHAQAPKVKIIEIHKLDLNQRNRHTTIDS